MPFRRQEVVYTSIDDRNARRRMFRYNRRMWKKHGRENLKALCVHGYYAGQVFNILPNSSPGYAARISLDNPESYYYYTLSGVQYVFIEKGESYGRCVWEGGVERRDIVEKGLRKVGIEEDMYTISGYDSQGRYFYE